MAVLRNGAKVQRLNQPKKNPTPPIYLQGVRRKSLKESILVTEIAWDNGGWNIPLPPSTVCVPKKDVVFEGETLDDLMTIREDEFRARVNDYLAERFGADVVGWRCSCRTWTNRSTPNQLNRLALGRQEGESSGGKQEQHI